MSPAGPLNTEKYDGYVSRNWRWNFAFNTADLSSVNLAKSFIFTQTILTLYASHLTSSAILIGLIPANQQLGFLLPQLLVAPKAESLERKKPFVVRISVMERLPYLFIALGILLWPGAPKWLAYILLAFSIGLATGSAGAATPAWRAMLGKIIHPNRRGLLFGLGFSIGGFLGIGGAFAARQILDSRPYPLSFGLCFLLAFVFQAVSWLFLTFNREPARQVGKRRPSLMTYLKSLPGFLRENPNFARYLLGVTVVVLGTMGNSFYIVYARRAFHVSDGFAGSLTMAVLLCQSVGTPLFGWLSDRLGHKWLTVLSPVLNISALLLVLVAPSPGWLYAVFILMNLSFTALQISRASITMEFGTIDKVPTYTALNGTLMAAPTLLAPILGGWLIDLFGFRMLFVLALIASAAGLVYLQLSVRDPRVARTGRR